MSFLDMVTPTSFRFPFPCWLIQRLILGLLVKIYVIQINSKPRIVHVPFILSILLFVALRTTYIFLSTLLSPFHSQSCRTKSTRWKDDSKKVQPVITVQSIRHFRFRSQSRFSHNHIITISFFPNPDTKPPVKILGLIPLKLGIFFQQSIFCNNVDQVRNDFLRTGFQDRVRIACSHGLNLANSTGASQKRIVSEIRSCFVVAFAG